MNDQESNVQVFVRIRPPEKQSVHSAFQVSNQRRITVKEKSSYRTFVFDKVFVADANQETIFNSVMSPAIEDVLEGYNTTVFAYGPSRTGKTYTILGKKSCAGEPDQDPESGFIARSLGKLFDQLDSKGCEYAIRISFLGIINEELIDLLSSREEESKLKLMDDNFNKGGIIVHGLEDIVVHNKKNAFEILDRGLSRRDNICSLNSCYSCCHMIINITVHFKKTTVLGEEFVNVGKLNFVDLVSTDITSGSLDSLRDVGKRNQSLLTLCRVIMSLNENSSHVPYRESKLTRLLQDSLGGSTKTYIVATLSCDQRDVDETLNTLHLMNKAKNIINTPIKNKRLSPADLKCYAEEISRLHRELDACRGNKGFYISATGYEELVDKITYLTEEKQKVLLEINNLKSEYSKKEEIFKVLNIKFFTEVVNPDVDKLQTKSEKLVKILKHNQKVYSTFQQKCSEHMNNVNELTSSVFTNTLDFLNETSGLSVKSDAEAYSYQSVQSLINGGIDHVQRDLNTGLIDLEPMSRKQQQDICDYFINREKLIKKAYEDRICETGKKFHDFVTRSENAFSTVCKVYNEKLMLASKISDGFVKSCEEKEKKSREECLTLVKNSETTKEFVKDMKENWVSNLRGILKQISTFERNLLNVDSNLQNDSTEKNLMQVINCQKSIIKRIINLHDIGSKVSEDIDNLKESQKTLQSVLDNFKEHYCSIHENSNHEQKVLKENCLSLKEDQLVHKSKIDSNITATLDHLNEFKLIKDTLRSTSSNLEEIICHNKAILDSVGEKCTELLCCINDYENENKDATNNLVNEIPSSINRMNIEKAKVIQQIELLQVSLNKFIDDEMRSYTPTGDTPKRQNYNYQSNFKATSPHDQLRERFKMKYIQEA